MLTLGQTSTASRLAPAVLVAALALAGCGGDDTGGATSSPSSSSSSSSSSAASSDSPISSASAPPSSPPGSASGSASPTVPDGADQGTAVTADLVAVVSQTAAGGEVSTTAFPLLDDTAVATFADQFDAPAMLAEIRRAVARSDTPATATLYAAVVAIGCDVPTDVVVTQERGGGDGGLLVEAAPAKESGIQCLAPVTSVAIVRVPDA